MHARLLLVFLLIAPSATAEPQHATLGVGAGVDGDDPLLRADVGFRFTFTRQWEGTAYGTVGWVADRIVACDFVAAARVRPLAPDSPWHVSFGAFTGLHFGPDDTRDYLGPFLATGLSLDAARMWDLDLQVTVRIDTEREDVTPQLVLRLGVAL